MLHWTDMVSTKAKAAQSSTMIGENCLAMWCLWADLSFSKVLFLWVKSSRSSVFLLRRTRPLASSRPLAATRTATMTKALSADATYKTRVNATHILRPHDDQRTCAESVKGESLFQKWVTFCFRMTARCNLPPRPMGVIPRNSDRNSQGKELWHTTAVVQQWNHCERLPANLVGPLSMLPPKPAPSQNGGAQCASQWQFFLLLHTCDGGW